MEIPINVGVPRCTYHDVIEAFQAFQASQASQASRGFLSRITVVIRVMNHLKGGVGDWLEKATSPRRRIGVRRGLV